MFKIKILSGWSNPGGSTVAFINLCNLFNSKGLDCTFYGPHTWHLNKCKADTWDKFTSSKEESIICHFINLQARPPCTKLIYSCHESTLVDFSKKEDLFCYDTVHFVSEKQRQFHNISFPSVIIPNVITDLQKSKCTERIAGVIGSIDSHKQTHLSIERALRGPCSKILVFGNITDIDYYKRFVQKYEKYPRVKFMGHIDDVQKMYDMISDVYHSSKSETFNYIKEECKLTNVSYLGLESAESECIVLNKDEILNKWIQILN